MQILFPLLISYFLLNRLEAILQFAVYKYLIIIIIINSI